MVSEEISIVIPTLNESARIGQRLEELSNLDGISEIVVADGGSSDGTPQIAARYPRARVIHAAPGRASQMNAGAREARGMVLLFLHADVSLPADAIRWVRRTLWEPEVTAGAFRTWTRSDAEGTKSAWWLHLADLRSRYSPLPYGDQAIFLRHQTFFELGGFPELPLMEDLEFSRRLRRHGRIRILPISVTVSGRRFLAHPIRDTLLVNLFPLLYRMGVHPGRLARFYQNVR